MQRKMNRREFVAGSAATGLAAALPLRLGTLENRAPTVVLPPASRPLVIASANGLASRDAAGKCAVEKAYEMILAGGDVLDAVIAGVNIVELDPKDTSVGYGGLPNADGVVQLDSCCMHGPRRRAGGVAALEGVKTPSLVAKAVLDNTDHHLLAGAGAREFARRLGFEVLPDLNTPESRRLWLEWKRRTDGEHYLDPKARADAGLRATRAMAAEGLLDPEHLYGTINCDGMNARGEICGVTTTSGMAFKIPGRVGDSPILGAGLYVDNDVGAVGSTGRGEANLYNLTSFLIAENLRRGMRPGDAGLDALRRVTANTVEKRLLTPRGHPSFGLDFYILDKRSGYAGVSLYPSRFAVCDERGARIEDTVPLFPGETAG